MKRKTMKDPVTFTLRIEEEIYNKLLKEAEDKGVSVSAVMRWAVVAYLGKGGHGAAET
jgi:predicted HicB family RNase H-like nuclease